MVAAKPLFGTLITLYLFLGGLSAGGFLVMSAWSLAFHSVTEQQSYRLKRAFKSLMGRSYAVSLALLAISVLCLVMDLGMPSRALTLFTRPNPNVLTFGAYALLLELTVGLLLAIANIFDISFISGRMRRALEWVCCVVSLAVIAYTGVFLASNESVPFWNTWVLPALFLFSSISAGISVVLLIDYFIRDQSLLLMSAKPLHKAHIMILVMEALSLAAFITMAITNPATAKSIAILTSPGMLSTATIGVVGMGLVVPLLLESYTLRTKEGRMIPVSDVVCLMGMLCLRYVIILCGVH